MSTTAAAAAAPSPLAAAAAPPPVSSTPPPFCLACGFDFGHIIDGVDDRLAGGALVGLLVALVGLVCLLLGRCCCGKTAPQSKGYDRVEAASSAD
jgi:hypothetical protein